MDRDLLEKLRLLDTLDEFSEKMGLGVFSKMDTPTYPDPTIGFLSTMEYTFANPRVPTTKDGIINFKVKITAYSIIILGIYKACGFPTTTLWDVLADEDFVSYTAKIKKV